MHELIEARDEKRLLRLQRQLASHKLLIVDELGYVPLSQIGAELLFEVLSQRYERGATIVTSNLPFDEWTTCWLRAADLFDDPTTRPGISRRGFFVRSVDRNVPQLWERGGVLNSHNWK